MEIRMESTQINCSRVRLSRSFACEPFLDQRIVTVASSGHCFRLSFHEEVENDVDVSWKAIEMISLMCHCWSGELQLRATLLLSLWGSVKCWENKAIVWMTGSGFASSSSLIPITSYHKSFTFIGPRFIGAPSWLAYQVSFPLPKVLCMNLRFVWIVMILNQLFEAFQGDKLTSAPSS